MNRESISLKQAISLITLFIMGSTLVIGSGAEAGRDSWLAIILGMIFALPMLLIYARILSLFPGKDLFDIIEYIFGRFLNKIISILYIWFAFHLGVLVIRNLGEFINTVSLINTPMIVPMFCITFLCAWAVKSGIEILGRWSEFTLIILILFIAITMILLIPIINLTGIQPMLFKGCKPVLLGAFSFFSFPLAETIIFCLIFSYIEGGKSSYYKAYMWGLIIGGTIVLITSLTEILVLGEFYYTSFYFPSHSTISRVGLSSAIQRMEIVVSITFLGAGFIKISICLLGTCNGIAKLFRLKNYKFIVTPISLLMLILSYSIYDSMIEMFEWAFKTWRYYAFPFQVILPIIILICAELKKDR